MIILLKNIFNILSYKQKFSLAVMQLLVVFVGFLEIITITLIGYFVSLIFGQKNLNFNNLYFVKNLFFVDELNNLFFVSIFLFIFLLISSIFLIVANYLSTSFATKLGTQLAKNLYKYYLNQDIIFYSQNNASRLLKKISNDTEIVIDNFFIPLIQLNAKIILLIVIIIFLFFINPIILILGFLFFFLIYYSIYKIIRLKIQKISQNCSAATEDRYKIITESFSGIREIIMNNSFKTFTNIFNLKSDKISNYRIRNFFLISSIRYFIEFLALSSIILLVIYLIKIKNDNFLTILPLLAIYAFAIIRILPLFQQIYTLLSQIKVGMVSFFNLQEDFNFINSNKYKKLYSEDSLIISNSSLNSLKYGITLKNITFSYENKINVLEDINMFIPVKKITGIVGITGSGKSTLIDIITGLLYPNSGELLIDNTRLDINDLSKWRNMIGYVSQNIFLLDGTILENIIFDLNNENINLKKIEDVIKNCGLENFIKNLPYGFKTRVGQNGIQLSGGQKQRLSIARALYKNPEILILDEATSSLDVLTESFVIESIKNLFSLKTVILVAHRFSIIKNCDYIYYLNDGKILAQGSYSELIRNNKDFNHMTKI